jgi:hypothetical protein
MDSNEKPFQDLASPAAAPQSSLIRSNDSNTSTTLTVGSIFAFAIMGTLPIIATAWVIRKLMIRSHHHVQQTRVKQHKQLRQINQAISGYTNNHEDNLDTPTGSIRSFKLNSEEFQSTPLDVSVVDPNVPRRMTSSQVSSEPTVTRTQQCEPIPSIHQIVSDEYDQVTDGDDTITARLYENCVRLQQALKFPIFETAMGTLNSKQSEARAKEYRRACRPQRMYFDEVVPTDVELGLQKSREKSRSSTSMHGKDELLHPSKRDPGIIQRYFGTSNVKDNYSGNDDDDSCPNRASISSGSESSSGLSDNNSDTNDDGYYDANLYDDFRELGELVDL